MQVHEDLSEEEVGVCDKISVVVPLFNRMDAFEKCVESLRAQTLGVDNVELIVVDDCSTDGAAEYLRGLAGTVPNLRVITHSTNSGLSAARNSGIEAASGDVILFLDSDMAACPTLLQQHLKAHAQRQDGRLAVVCNVTYPDKFIDGSNFSRFMQARELGFRSNSGRAGLDYNNLPYNFFAGGGTSVKREFVRQIGGFDSNFTTYGCEDEEFGWRLKRAGGTIAFLNSAVVYHHDIISMSRVKRKMMEAASTSYKIIATSNPEQMAGTKVQFTLPIKFGSDSAKTILVKLGLIMLLNRFSIFSLEMYLRKTDGIAAMYSERLLRALTAGWMVLAARGHKPSSTGVWK